MVEGTFSASADLSHGYLPYGTGLYRKHFTLPAATSAALAAGSHVAYIEFDGAQTSTDVYVNGVLLGKHASGYTPFLFRMEQAHLSQAASVGEVLLAAKVDATKPDGWWYDGGGLYRHVRLVVVRAFPLSRPSQQLLPRLWSRQP